MNPNGQNVIVTGAGSGIGLAFVKRLGGLKANVWALDNNRTALDAASRELSGEVHAHFEYCDVGDEPNAIETVGRIEQASGGITILVNNAAILRDQTLVSKLRGRVRTHSMADWLESLRSNLTGTFLMSREVAATMVKGRRSGLIVNISSISRLGNPGQTAYAASKAGIDALTVTWSQELGLYGIRVVGIAPGFVDTPMTHRIPQLFLEKIRQQTPLKRFGTLEEFGQTLQHVIENDYLNGKTLEVDGGLRF